MPDLQDLFILGGGIVGAGIACDAALRGLSVTLIDKHTVGWGTSSRSSRMIHGGIRCLELGDIHLVREALAERAILLRTIVGNSISGLHGGNCIDNY
jgi:glycerol-3-phosphate dehydrogenase